MWLVVFFCCQLINIKLCWVVTSSELRYSFLEDKGSLISLRRFMKLTSSRCTTANSLRRQQTTIGRRHPFLKLLTGCAGVSMIHTVSVRCWLVLFSNMATLESPKFLLVISINLFINYAIIGQRFLFSLFLMPCVEYPYLCPYPSRKFDTDPAIIH